VVPFLPFDGGSSMTDHGFTLLVAGLILGVGILVLAALLSRKNRSLHIRFAVTALALNVVAVPAIELIRPKGFTPPAGFGLHLSISALAVLFFVFMLLTGIAKYRQSESPWHFRMVFLFIPTFLAAIMSGIAVFFPALWGQ